MSVQSLLKLKIVVYSFGWFESEIVTTWIKHHLRIKQLKVQVNYLCVPLFVC